jgi:hypothetical protein
LLGSTSSSNLNLQKATTRLLRAQLEICGEFHGRDRKGYAILPFARFTADFMVDLMVIIQRNPAREPDFDWQPEQLTTPDEVDDEWFDRSGNRS